MKKTYHSSYIRPHTACGEHVAISRQHHLNVRSPFVVVVLALGLFLLLAPAAYLAKQEIDLGNYKSFSSQVLTFDQKGSSSRQTQSIQNDALARAFESSPNMAAWLSVEGTDIAYPVAQATNSDPDRFLFNDLWGNPSDIGCPYIDSRSSTTSKHIAIYGHQLGVLGGMFSSLRTCWQAADFSNLGELSLSTIRGSKVKTQTYKPLCALKTDKINQEIQSFEFADDNDFRQWLIKILKSSSTQASDAPQLLMRASKVISLVTCSELRSGQNGRSVVFFVS